MGCFGAGCTPGTGDNYLSQSYHKAFVQGYYKIYRAQADARRDRDGDQA